MALVPHASPRYASEGEERDPSRTRDSRLARCQRGAGGSVELRGRGARPLAGTPLRTPRQHTERNGPR